SKRKLGIMAVPDRDRHRVPTGDRSFGPGWRSHPDHDWDDAAATMAVNGTQVQVLGGEEQLQERTSVINCVRFRDYFGRYTDRNGTAPEDGVDFEPNSAAHQGVTDAICVGTVATGNAGYGIQLSRSNVQARLYDI